MMMLMMIMMMMVMARMINLITIGLKRTELERLSKKKTASEEKEKSFRILYHFVRTFVGLWVAEYK